MWPAKWSRYIPSPFLVLIFSTLLTLWGNTGIATIGSNSARSGGDPVPEMPEFTIEQLGSLIPPAVTIALLGAIESLLCAVVADKQTNDRRTPIRELIAQGIANVVSPCFGGLAATSAMARTSANIRTARNASRRSRARHHCSGRVAGGQSAGETRSVGRWPRS